jgi:hypothetical protein
LITVADLVIFSFFLVFFCILEMKMEVIIEKYVKSRIFYIHLRIYFILRYITRLIKFVLVPQATPADPICFFDACGKCRHSPHLDLTWGRYKDKIQLNLIG